MEPLLSIVTITYNHEPYIRKCIEGVLMQQVNFPIEFIIAEDCSTDGTLAICKEYAEKYPDLIKLITSENNVGAIANERRAMKTAKGKYIAFCEGDDYWTDPLKLQKQVDFLENNPDYSVCFTRYNIYNETLDELYNDNAEYLVLHQPKKEVIDVTVEIFLYKWVTQYLTMLCRRDSLDITLSKQYHYYCDSHQIYHLLVKGKGALLNFISGIYNQTGQGTYTSLSTIKAQKKQVEIYRELWNNNKDIRLKNEYIRNIKYLLELLNKERQVISYFSYTFRLFFVTLIIKELLKNIYKYYK